jgi:hypothetical protein
MDSVQRFEQALGEDGFWFRCDVLALEVVSCIRRLTFSLAESDFSVRVKTSLEIILNFHTGMEDETLP